MKRGVFNYRTKGNCFAVCLTNGLQFLNDKKLFCKLPELKIFNIETLYNADESSELTPGLNYLVNNKYEVKIIDTDPLRGTYRGESLNNSNVHVEKPYRNYNKKDVEFLNKNEWVIIISTKDSISNKPHANLVFNNQIHDPINQDVWEKSFPWTDLEIIISRSEEKFCIAFKKKVV